MLTPKREDLIEMRDPDSVDPMEEDQPLDDIRDEMGEMESLQRRVAANCANSNKDVGLQVLMLPLEKYA